MASFPEKTWLKKHHVLALDGSLPRRAWWRRRRFPQALRAGGFDALLAPGSLLPRRTPGTSRVSISQNMLPFDDEARRRYGLTDFLRWKMLLLRGLQFASFRRAEGLIFLTEFAKEQITPQLRSHARFLKVIPHGIERRFFQSPRTAKASTEFTDEKPFRFLYVSIVDAYKHHREVAEAVLRLRKEGLPVQVEFVGRAYPPVYRRLQAYLNEMDPAQRTVIFRGALPFPELHGKYHAADAFVFASSCENLPNILLEAMAAGLPIASSQLGPMPEVLGDAGLYFDPRSVDSIQKTLKELFLDAEQRQRLAKKAYLRAEQYSWKDTADQTFAFVRQVAEAQGKKKG